MSNLPPKKVSYRQQMSPKRGGVGYSRPPAFQQLSPIIGSSPEPEQAKSQSSRIPRSQSTPPSRHESPARRPSPMNRHPPRAQTRNSSRNTSRETSPSKMVTSPTRAPLKSYRNVQAKVNCFNKPKPKVPPKPEVLNAANETKTNLVSKTVDESKYKSSQKTQLLRKDSENKIGNTPRTVTTKNTKNGNISVSSSSNSLNKTINSNGNNMQNQKSVKSTAESNRNSPEKSLRNHDGVNANTMSPQKGITMSPQKAMNNKQVFDNNGNENSMKKSESMNKLNDGASSTVVSCTTNTAAQPLKIDAKLDEHVKSTRGMAPIVDGRILSATSVSNAMNKMNDTVLSTNTVIKEHNHSKLSPAASAIISLSNPANNNQTHDSQNYSTRESVEAVLKYKSGNGDGTKNEQPGSIKRPNNTETNKMDHAVNHVNKFAVDHTPHADINAMQRSINDKILDARTVVAADVKPLKITVREKPVNAEVQSGNVRINHVTANGVSEIHG